MKQDILLLFPGTPLEKEITLERTRALLAVGVLHKKTPCVCRRGDPPTTLGAILEALGIEEQAVVSPDAPCIIKKKASSANSSLSVQYSPDVAAAVRRDPVRSHERDYLIMHGLIPASMVDNFTHTQARKFIRRHKRHIYFKKFLKWAAIMVVIVGSIFWIMSRSDGELKSIVNEAPSVAEDMEERTEIPIPSPDMFDSTEISEVCETPAADTKIVLSNEEKASEPIVEMPADTPALPQQEVAMTALIGTISDTSDEEAVGSEQALDDVFAIRAWRNKQGQSFLGIFVACVNGNVTVIRDEDKQEFTFPVNALSESDVRFLERQGLLKEVSEETTRVWTNYARQGVLARLVSCDKKNLTIERISDKALFSIPTDWLIEDDRLFLKRYMEKSADNEDSGVPKLNIRPFKNPASFSSKRFIEDVEVVLRAGGINGTESIPTEPFPIFKDVMFLEPVQSAVKKLGIRSTAFGHSVSTIGWNPASFYYYSYPLHWDSPLRPYSEIFFVTDLSNRVVAIQLNGTSKTARHHGLSALNMIRMIGFKSRFAAKTHACWSSSPITGQYVALLESSFWGNIDPKPCIEGTTGGKPLYGHQLYLPRCIGAIVLKNIEAIKATQTEFQKGYRNK